MSARDTKNPLRVLAAVVLLCAVAGEAWAQTNVAAAAPPRAITAVVGLPPGGAAQVVELAEGGAVMVYFQSPVAAEALAVRKAAAEAGLLGRRVFVQEGDYAAIHLADNLAGTALVGAAAQGKVSDAELLRVLHPDGKAVIGARALVKPFPAGTDDWSHPYHDPSNNPVSTDRLARWPCLTQFIAEPKFSPMPEVTVTAGGRIFKAFGNIATHSNQNPVVNKLWCINAFNGTLLWTRDLREGFIIHRNTMIATRDALYLADDESCKIIDAATGALKGELVLPEGRADGKVWKWMALEKGVLYALVGGSETKAPTARSTAPGLGGWPWGNWPGYVYGDPKTNTGFGRTFAAFDVATRRPIWNIPVDDYVDGRGVCMRDGRIYFWCPGKMLGCLDAATGKPLWKNSGDDLLKAVGGDLRAQNPNEGFATSCYLKCNDKYIFFAGPVRANLVACSTADGRLVWAQEKQGNHHLLLRDDALYIVGAMTGKLDYATGARLTPSLYRRACTRATASADSVFFRTGEGTARLNLADMSIEHIAAMRPPCQDGVVVSNGMLYWGPWMCGCNLSLYGHIALAPAGGVERHPASGGPRLTAFGGAAVKPAAAAADDWPCYLGDNARSGTTKADLSAARTIAWTYTPKAACEPTAPIAVGDLVIVADRSGAVRALGSGSGKPVWETFVGGAVYYPPAFENGRVFVGADDGRVTALEAATGRELWRYRLAPAERVIPVMGRLMSTWPVAGGVVAKDGVVYAAAGIAHHDGTCVVALDAASGKVKWYDDASGELSPKLKSGISLQGPLRIENGELRFLGGNVYEIARFDLATGKCVNPVVSQNEPRSSAKNAFYPYYPEYAGRATVRRDLPDGRVLLCDPAYDRGPSTLKGQMPRLALLKAPADPNAALPPYNRREAAWQKDQIFRAFVLGSDVLLAASLDALAADAPRTLAAVKIDDGRELWRQALPGAPVRDGLAVDAKGRVFVALEDGRVLALTGLSRNPPLAP